MQTSDKIIDDQQLSNEIINELLSEAQLADSLNKTVRTLQRWHALRIGPPRVKIGRSVYYRKQAVRDWIKAQEQHEPRAAGL